jgi:hypothetical protein
MTVVETAIKSAPTIIDAAAQSPWGIFAFMVSFRSTSAEAVASPQS